MLRTDRRSALAGLAPGECLVATHVVSESADDWPANLTVILWPSPDNRRVLNELSLTADNALSLKVLELKEIHHRNAPTP